MDKLKIHIKAHIKINDDERRTERLLVKLKETDENSIKEALTEIKSWLKSLSNEDKQIGLSFDRNGLEITDEEYPEVISLFQSKITEYINNKKEK